MAGTEAGTGAGTEGAVEEAMGKRKALEAVRAIERRCKRCGRDVLQDLAADPDRALLWAVEYRDMRPCAYVCPDCLTDEEHMAVQVNSAITTTYVDGGRFVHRAKPEAARSRLHALELAKADMGERPAARLVLHRIATGKLEPELLEEWWSRASDLDPTMRRAWAVVYGAGGIAEQLGEEVADVVAYHYLGAASMADVERLTGASRAAQSRALRRALQWLGETEPNA